MKYLFLILIFSLSASAAEKKIVIPKKHFTLLVKRKMDEAWYSIYQKDKKWICVTNAFPYFKAKENPLSKLDWKELTQESKERRKDCETLIAMENSLLEKSESVVTCADQKHTVELYKRIADLCRSKI